MKITRLYIKNYKSIKEIDICLSELVNVFIGENSVGKSNIFAAIDWMLGPVFRLSIIFERRLLSWRYFVACSDKGLL